MVVIAWLFVRGGHRAAFCPQSLSCDFLSTVVIVWLFVHGGHRATSCPRSSSRGFLSAVVILRLLIHNRHPGESRDPYGVAITITMQDVLAWIVPTILMRCLRLACMARIAPAIPVHFRHPWRSDAQTPQCQGGHKSGTTARINLTSSDISCSINHRSLKYLNNRRADFGGLSSACSFFALRMRRRRCWRSAFGLRSITMLISSSPPANNWSRDFSIA